MPALVFLAIERVARSERLLPPPPPDGRSGMGLRLGDPIARPSVAQVRPTPFSLDSTMVVSIFAIKVSILERTWRQTEHTAG